MHGTYPSTEDFIMRIGLTGSHRCGKTTLMHAFSAASGLPTAPSTVSQIAARAGYDMSQSRMTAAGLDFQDTVLDTMAVDYALPAFVSDRTPLDAAAYTMCDAVAGTGDLDDRILAYRDRALRLTASLFDVIVLVQPGIPVVSAPGKPPLGAAYQEHFNYVAYSLAAIDAPTRFGVIPRFILSIEDRVNSVGRLAYGHSSYGGR